MLNTREAREVLDHDFLETRGKILEIAAVLDRIDRSPTHHPENTDPRLGQIRQALEAICIPGPFRAGTIQMIFSVEYDRGWREKIQLGQAPEVLSKY